MVVGPGRLPAGTTQYGESAEDEELAEVLPPGDLLHEEQGPAGVVAGIRHAGPIAVAGLAANGLNVVVTVVIARLLTSRGYGELAQLNGVFLFLSMPGSALLVGVVRRVTALRSSGGGNYVRHFAKRLHRLALLGLVVLVGLAWIFEHAIAKALSLDSSGGIVPIVCAGGIWLALSIDRGLLQAQRSYNGLAANLLVEGAMRMVFVLVLTAAGLGVTGACLGVMLGEACAAAHARFLSSRKWKSEVARPGNQEASPSSRRHLVTDVLCAFGCLAFLALLQNLDVILLGREAPKYSGEYAAISVAAKAIVFGAIALGGYLLPEATIRWHRGGHALKQLATTALILAVPTVVLLAASIVAPRLLLRIAFGHRLIGASSSFSTLVAAMAFLCITVLLTNYLLGAGMRWIVLVLGMGTVVAGFVFYAMHGKPGPTARADLILQAGLAAVVGIGFLKVHHTHERLARSTTALKSLVAQGSRVDRREQP